MNATARGRSDTHPAGVTLRKWGAIAWFVMAFAIPAGNWLYFTGNLRQAMGAFSYSLADLLYGPIWMASLATAVNALREWLGSRASQRMNLALLAAVAAGAAMLAVACIRATNRQYHLMHPEAHLESSADVLIVWTTLVTGINATGWHLLGWAYLLIGSAGWTSRILPRALCGLFWVAGAASLFVYVWPELEGAAVLTSIAVSIWQGLVLWRAPSDPISGK